LKVSTNKINPELGNICPVVQKGFINVPYQVNEYLLGYELNISIHEKDMLN